MKLLLDTHIVLWGVLEPSKLTDRVAQTLESATAELFLSPITAWEILLLVEKGHVVLDDDPVRWLHKVYRRLPW